MQIADTNKGNFTGVYQSAMSLLVMDFTYLKGLDDELVVKELSVVDSYRLSSYDFERPYYLGEVPAFNARINQAIVHWYNWNDGFVLY